MFTHFYSKLATSRDDKNYHVCDSFSCYSGPFIMSGTYISFYKVEAIFWNISNSLGDI